MPAQAPVSDQLAFREAVGLQPLDGILWAAGPGYRAAFRGDGVEFTPALGKVAPRPFPLTLRTNAIGRGDVLRSVSDVAPTSRGLQVRYVRRECVERYDVTKDGIAQSFVFDALPTGNGDLVVRLACATELPLTAPSTDGLRFELSELGGVLIGGVTGIDSNGRSTRGTITCTNGTIELRLPAAFVDGAAMPLVLDPQIGPVFSIATSSLDYQNPDVTHLQSASAGGQYLCVFERYIAANDRDLRALRFDLSGATLGTLTIVSSGTTDDHDPAVASIALRDVFVVAYERGGDLLARSITPAGVVSAETIVAQGTDNQSGVDVGGEITTADDDAIVVWHNSTQKRIQGLQLSYSASGVLSAFGTTDLAIATSSLTTLGAPRITQDGGSDGRFLLVYPSTTLSMDTSTRVVAVNRNLTVLDSMTLTTSGDDEDSGQVAGDGEEWVVVFESEPSEGTGDNNIVAVPVHWRHQVAALHASSPRTVTGLVNVDELDPAISRLDHSYLVAWRRRAAPGSTDTEVFMKTIDPIACTTCEATVLLANSNATETNLATASSLDGRYAFIAWEADTAGNGDLQGAVWEAADGYALIGSSCGTAGRIAVGCARVGNQDFRVDMHDGPLSFGSFLVLSPDATFITCGPCTLIANPFTGFVSTVVPGINGLAAYNLAIPANSSLSGIGIRAQWIVAPASGQCTYLGADFSSAAQIIIE